MAKKLLMTASTFAHIRHFHLPYLKAFKGLGWQVHVACGGEYQEVPWADRCIPLPLEKKYLCRANLKTLKLLRGLYKRENYDLVITHTSLASFFTRLAQKGIRPHPKTINVVHGYLFDDETKAIKAAVLKLAEHLAAPQTDKIITMNEYDTSWAKKAFPETRVEFIHGMGLSEQRIKSHKPERENEDVILFYAAEFSKRKNQGMLIRAMALLPENYRLVLAGEGDLLDNCKALAKESNVYGRVEFLGYVQNVPELLEKADIAVSSSRSEGLPFNIIEAMAAGLPIVASDVKGNRDLIQDGVNGYLYGFNDISAFVASVEKAAEDKSGKLGARGQIISREYTLDKVLPEVMKAYLD